MKKSYELTMLAVSLLVVLSLGSANAAYYGGNLVSHWTFDGNLLDSVGGEDGTLENWNNDPIESGYVAGHDGTPGGALHITEVATQVNIGTTATAFDVGTGDFTFTGWIKVSDLAAAGDRIAAKFGGWKNTVAKVVWNARWDEGGIGGVFENYNEVPDPGRLRFFVYGAPPNSNVQASDPNQIDDNQWHWVGMRVDAGEMTLWVDGGIVGTATYGINTTMDAGGRATIFGGEHGDIVLDEYKVWHEALSDENMWADYIPEPATLSMLVFGALAGLLGRRRR